jgi:Recombinase zinc beta ribbon domain
MTLSVPQIVSPELWNIALDQLRVNSTRQETKHHALLRGKIRCRNCGSSYTVSTVAGRPYRYYRCIRSLRSPGQLCRSASVNATALESHVWGECLDLLAHPGVIEQSAADEILRLDEADKDRANETQRLQKALAEQEAAKQRIIRLVHLGKISDEDADRHLDEINAEVGRIHAQLSVLDSSRSLAGEYVRRLRTAEALVMRIAKGVNRGIVNLEDDGHRRRIVDVLLHGIEVKTIGEGRDRRVELTFRWLGQDPSGLVDPQELGNILLDDEGNSTESPPSGVKVSRPTAALAEQTTYVTSGLEASRLRTAKENDQWQKLPSNRNEPCGARSLPTITGWNPPAFLSTKAFSSKT